MNINDVRYSAVLVQEYLHATGGLRASKRSDGWVIGPMPASAGDIGKFGPVSDEHVKRVLMALGGHLFGADEVVEPDSLLPSRIWTPLLGAPRLTSQPGDAWGSIAEAAGAAGDVKYAALARNVSVSLRAAGIRLRDASDEYHRQLLSAIAHGQKPGLRFANTALADLHLAFHSLLSEMGSVRDYLASVGAHRVGAPEKVDAASRLADWVKKSAGRAAVADPLVATILAAWDPTASDPWLHDLGEHRNLFLHRQPLGADEHSRWLRLVEHTGVHGRALLITMQIENRPGRTEVCDALARFVELHEKLCRLADLAASLARHAPRPAVFVVADRPNRMETSSQPRG